MTAKKGKPKRAPLEREVAAEVRKIQPKLLPPTQVVSAAELDNLQHVAQLRQVASVDFITDPDQQTVEMHWARTDRPWRKAVLLSTMQAWAKQDRWHERRTEFWDQVRVRILESRQHEIAKQRIKEVRVLEESRDALVEYLQPVRLKDGTIKRYPATYANGNEHALAGLPVLPLGLPSMDRFVKALIELDRHIRQTRGEIPMHAEGGTDDLSEASQRPISALSNQKPLSPTEIRSMARTLLRERQPDLQEQPEIAVKLERGRNGIT